MKDKELQKAIRDALREERLSLIQYNALIVIFQKLIMPLLMIWSIYYFGVKRPLQEKGKWKDWRSTNIPTQTISPLKMQGTVNYIDN